MNSLYSNITGGFPFRLDDLRWIEAATKLAFGDIFGVIPEANFILWGCTVTDAGTDWSISEGAVVIAYEVFHFSATTIAKDATNRDLHLIKTTSYDPSGTKNFADGSTQETYEVRDAGIVRTIALGVDSVKIVNNNTITDAPTFNKLVGTEGWIDLPLASYTSPYQQASVKFQFRKMGDMVEIRGSFARTSAATVNTDSNMATLPTGYRPIQEVYIMCPSNGTAAHSAIRISIAGTITIMGGTVGDCAFGTTGGPYIYYKYQVA